MRNIKSRENRTTEIRLIKILHEQGIEGWRRGYPVKGHPDFVFIDKRLAIFVDGCFWHGHDCRNTHPHENKDFWATKISRSIEHDNAITKRFKSRGWKTIRIWECELKKKNRNALIARLEVALSNKRAQPLV